MSLSEQKLIFITGASRSGTTLMSFVLRNHAEVYGLKEMHYFGEIWDPRETGVVYSEQQLIEGVARVYMRQDKGILANCDSGEYHDEAKKLLASMNPDEKNPAGVFAAAVVDLAKRSGKTIPCEQTPRNIFYAEALLSIYPNAHIVHMIRDPRAVMASQKSRWKRRSLATKKEGFSRYQSLRVWVNYHPYTVARMWASATRTALRIADHPRVTLVSFEDLLQQPEATVRALCEDLGLQFDRNMLDVGRINSSHASSVGGAKKGLQTDAIDQWQEKLSAAEIAVTERRCGHLMDAVGLTASGAPPLSMLASLRYKLSYLLHLAGVVLINPGRAITQLRALSSARGEGPAVSSSAATEKISG